MHNEQKWSCKTKELLRQVHRSEKSTIKLAGGDGKAPEFGYSQAVFEGSTNPVKVMRQGTRRQRGGSTNLKGDPNGKQMFKS
jgi:hypothetical protein